MIADRAQRWWHVSAIWARRFFHWLIVAPLLVWLIVVGISIAWFLATLLSGTPSDCAAIMGVMLQLAGLVIVAIGLSSMRRLFGRTSIVQRAMSWLHEFAKIFAKPRTVSVQGTVSAHAVASSHATVWRSAASGASLEDRIEAVEQNLKELSAELEHHKRVLGGRLAQLESSLPTERSERVAADRAIEKKLEEVAVGGLHLETIGLAWLSLGIVLGTVPQQSADAAQSVLAFIVQLLG